MFPIARSVPVAADLISRKRQEKKEKKNHTGVTASTGGRQELADSGELEEKGFPARHPVQETDVL